MPACLLRPRRRRQAPCPAATSRPGACRRRCIWPQYQGWFKEAGLDVDIQDGRGSGNTIQLVNAGQADVGQVQVGLVGSARAKGATIKSIATFQRKTDLCVLVDKDSPISKVADLRGKTVVVFAASPWAPFVDEYLKSGGLTRSDLKVDVVVPRRCGALILRNAPMG